jgi:hypothetical protein
MFSSPPGEREAERPPGPAGNRHLSASSEQSSGRGGKVWVSPRETGCRTPFKVAGPGGDPSAGGFLAGDGLGSAVLEGLSSDGWLIFLSFTVQGIDFQPEGGKLEGLPRRGFRKRIPMVCVRFLRTQQCAKSQCLFGPRPDGCPADPCMGVGWWLSGFGFLWQVMILAGILSVQVWQSLLRRSGCRLALTESLILAQDERWRRA